MNNKKISIIVGVVVVLAVLFIAVSSNTKKKATSNNTKQVPIEVPVRNDTVGNIELPKEYTLSEIATHNNSSSCWTTINSGVYDLTTWISSHPGGRDAILSLCGIDGSIDFNAQHGGQSEPESELVSFKIGDLVN